MENKKIIIIVAVALLLSLLCAFLFFKYNELNKADENMLEIEEVQEVIEVSPAKEETVAQPDETKTQTAKPVAKQTVKPAAVQKVVETEADKKAVEELKATESITEKSEPSNEVVIDQEYKMKSPDKYSFK